MISYVKGNLLDDSAEALVNTVNEVGVMGKGIALMFSERYPESSEAYQRACEAKEVHVGRMFVTRNAELWGPRWVIHFPTKKHWRHPSKLEWVREGLKDLVRVIQDHNIRSVALPPLGCGNGGLIWEQVRREIEGAFAVLPDVDARVYAPASEYQNAPKREGVRALTPARALVVGAVWRYLVLGLDCTNLEVQKLAWFLSKTIKRLGLSDPLKLKFGPNRYGPYADNLRHLLNALDGSYLHCEKRLADAGPLDLIWVESDECEVVLKYLQSDAASTYVAALDEMARLIDGFESPLGMELLATIDWLVQNGTCSLTVKSVREGLAAWPSGQEAGRRKQKIFSDRLIGLGIDRLTAWYKANPNYTRSTDTDA